jgi:hypothetical protein
LKRIFTERRDVEKNEFISGTEKVRERRNKDEGQRESERVRESVREREKSPKMLEM